MSCLAITAKWRGLTKEARVCTLCRNGVENVKLSHGIHTITRRTRQRILRRLTGHMGHALVWTDEGRARNVVQDRPKQDTSSKRTNTTRRRRPDGVAIFKERKLPTQATVAPCNFKRTERNTAERLKPALERMEKACRKMLLDWRSKLTLHNN